MRCDPRRICVNRNVAVCVYALCEGMDTEGDAANIVKELTEGEGEEEEEYEGEEGTGPPAAPVGERPSIDTQNFEVVQEPEPGIVDETPTNNDNGGSLVEVEEQPLAPDVSQLPVVDETPKTAKEKSPAGPTPVKETEAPPSLIQVKLQIDASMDNDELEAVRQTMSFVLGFYRKWHEDHYHRDKTAFVLGRSARAIAQFPKNDDCLPEFHAKVEGIATTYASRLAEVALQVEPQLISKTATPYQQFASGSGDRSEDEIWAAFREQAESLFKSGESWEKFVAVLLLAYLVCLSDEVRQNKRATGFLRSFIQYLVAERRVRWVARHGGWANAPWGLRRHRLARCLCAKSTMYGFILISIGVAAVGIFLTKKQQQ